MPSAILNRIPLPNIKIYTTISVLLISGCLYYSIISTNDPSWQVNVNISSIASIKPAISLNTDLNTLSNELGYEEYSKSLNENIENDVFRQETNKQKTDNTSNSSRTVITRLNDVISFIFLEPICVWVVINMAYCCLVLLGKFIQKLVFGDLRISEQQHLKDKFWNFVFYKFILVFGIINVQYMNEVMLWISWFSILGFLHLLSQLSKDRFEYLSFSPMTPGWSHFRLLFLLISILTISLSMIIIATCIGLNAGFNIFAFMSAECFLLIIKSSHVLVRYGIFLYDMQRGEMANDTVSWDKRGPYAYYTEFVLELSALIIDLGHHMHMLLWSNIFLSMASLVIVMQLKCLGNEIQRKLKKHRNYRWVQNHMEKRYPLATPDDLSQNSDKCAICWEKMERARKLPCGHLFHNSCLQSWLEQDTSCPTCRFGLNLQNIDNGREPIERIEDNDNTVRGNNHFFQFNGSRYASWLPNFSVEVSNINSVLGAGSAVPTTTHTIQIRNMARQVQEMFPHYSLSMIISDLQVSHSIELTIHNILEGRLSISSRLQDFSGSEFSEDANAPGNSNEFELNSMSESMTTNSANDYYVNPDFSSSSSNSSSMFSNQNDLLKDDNLGYSNLGDRFSKSSSEREQILQRRKIMLLAIARKKYIEKNKSVLNTPPESERIRYRRKSSMEGLRTE